MKIKYVLQIADLVHMVFYSYSLDRLFVKHNAYEFVWDYHPCPPTYLPAHMIHDETIINASQSHNQGSM